MLSRKDLNEVFPGKKKGGESLYVYMRSSGFWNR